MINTSVSKVILLLMFSSAFFTLEIMNNANAVFTIPYTTTFRSDKFSKAMGCDHNIVFGNYIYPFGAKDALSLYISPHFYGGSTVRCQFKTLFAKALGTGQDYK